MSRSTAVLPARPMRSRFGVARRRLGSAIDGRLFFAQVREDPMLEIEAFEPSEGGTYVVVGSGGCTALSLLAAGAGRVVAVDMNATQNHVTELKAAAVAALDPVECAAFLGAAPMDPACRYRRYGTLRPFLSDGAARYWDVSAEAVRRGILGAGVSERFIGSLSRLVRAVVHPEERIERLLACDSLAEQVRLYDEEWNSRKWRMLFNVLLNRWTLGRTYDPAFFTNVKNASFASHFHGVFERTVTLNPVADNYFLHHMLTGFYPARRSSALPPYLDPRSDRMATLGVDGLEIIDGSFQDYLSSCETSSVDGIALSNICEWSSDGEAARLFSSVARVARPGATVCFRNFAGHTEVPERLAGVIHEDRNAGAMAIRRDRSCVQSRFAVCTVEKSQ